MKIKRRKFLKIAASFPVIGSTMIPKISSQQEKSNDEIQKLIEIIVLGPGPFPAIVPSIIANIPE